MKHIDDLLPAVVEGIIEKSRPEERPSKKCECNEATAERTLSNLKSLFGTETND